MQTLITDWRCYERNISEYFAKGKMSLYYLLESGANHPQVKPWADVNMKKVKRDHLKHSTGAPVRSIISAGMKVVDNIGEHKYRKDSMKGSFLMCPGCLLLYGRINRGMPHCPIYFCKVRI